MNGRASVDQPNSLSFDLTQTVRALTPHELRDPNQQKWLAIQLAVVPPEQRAGSLTGKAGDRVRNLTWRPETAVACPKPRRHPTSDAAFEQ